VFFGQYFPRRCLKNPKKEEKEQLQAVAELERKTWAGQIKADTKNCSKTIH
jgi:hypothetical protein